MSDGLKTILIAHSAAPEQSFLSELITASIFPASSAADEEPFRMASTLSDALTEIKSGWIPDLVVVYQGVPDEFPQMQIDELIGLLPLAHFIITFGPWCESIGRTEQQWPVAWCIPIRHLPACLERTEKCVASGEPSMPATASRDEAFSFSARRVNSAASDSHLRVFVSGDDPHFVLTVRDQMKAAGVALVDRCSEAEVIVLTASLLSSRAGAELLKLRSEAPAARCYLLCDLLTPDEVRQFEADGVIALSQLRFAEELAGLLFVSPRQPA